MRNMSRNRFIRFQLELCQRILLDCILDVGIDECPFVCPLTRLRDWRSSSLTKYDLISTATAKAVRRGYRAMSHAVCRALLTILTNQLMTVDKMPGRCPVRAAAAARDKASFSRESTSWNRASIWMVCAADLFSYRRIALVIASSWVCRPCLTSAATRDVSRLLFVVGPFNLSSNSDNRCAIACVWFGLTGI